ncbi:2-nitropropane dioxygenase [Armillaria luteobubalina]|uniref:2-nitropropane dioxygenase n=1 Tax=Armillaria luteobubalina TaxID=153913 RepID=A0AA39QBS5_9AGAR|nr:2-nitropropane dioxygenase [Armillaria luteobubalina]
MAIISTPVTELFGIKHPILLAGMNVAAGPELAAAVSNAGGLGVIGGHGYTSAMLRQQIKAIKKDLNDPGLPFGVDLLLPQVGGSARKTNYDYTKGHLDQLIGVIIDEKASLFVCAVGVPPRSTVMNMVGHPKHVPKALSVGVDIICAQAGEGGGHTGDCVDVVKGHKSPLNGKPVYVIGAGAVFDGRSLVANLSWGAQAVWVGTRFVASVEAGAPKLHKELVTMAGFDDAVTTLIYTGRPLRCLKTPYVQDWETNRQDEIRELTSKGIIPAEKDLEEHPEKSISARPWLMGTVSALIHDILPAKDIVENMINDAVEIIQRDASRLSKAKL